MYCRYVRPDQNAKVVYFHGNYGYYNQYQVYVSYNAGVYQVEKFNVNGLDYFGNWMNLEDYIFAADSQVDVEIVDAIGNLIKQ